VAKAGQVIHNPVTGETIRVVTPSSHSNGRRFVFECRVAPGHSPLPAHVHDRQEERFEMISGKLGVLVGNEVHTLYPGDRAVLPAGVKHQWWNPTKGDVVFRVEVTPAGDLEAVIEALAAMAQTGKLNSKAMPKNPFDLANVGRLSETYLPFLPIALQKRMLAVGSAVGRLFGASPDLSAYRSAPSGAGNSNMELAA
jgi:quercetin dioxygenase-like cupin family protein